MRKPCGSSCARNKPPTRPADARAPVRTGARAINQPADAVLDADFGRMFGGALSSPGGCGGRFSGCAWISLQHLDGLVELWILARQLLRHVLVDHDIGFDAVAFDCVLAVEPDNASELRHVDAAAVDQGPEVAKADHAAPGARADQGAQLRLLEHVREDVAVR